jgi:hypothetical protein
VQVRAGRLPLQALRVETNGPDFVEDLVESVSVFVRLCEQLPLEFLAVPGLGVVEAGRADAPCPLTPVAGVVGDAMAVFDPLDLVGEEMGLVADDVNRWRDPRALRQGRG